MAKKEYKEVLKFKDSIYTGDLDGEHGTSIDCDLRMWQNMVLTGVVILDYKPKNIAIYDVWKYVRYQLDLHGISYESMDPDEDIAYNTPQGLLSVESAVYAYLRYLCQKKYIVSLNTRMGHADEETYDVSEKLRRQLIK